MSTGAGLGMGLNLSGPEADPAIAANEAIDPMRPGRGAIGRPRPRRSPFPWPPCSTWRSSSWPSSS